MQEYIMALDQGTTSSRCMIFDKKGNIVTKAQQEFDNYYPQAGFVEQDAKEIWNSQLAYLAGLIIKTRKNFIQKLNVQ